MKQLMLFFLAILILGCDKDEFLDGPWTVTSLKNVELYTRPKNHSNFSRSPDSVDIKAILEEQNLCIDTINARLGVNSTSKFKIFLFNKDEAEELIGTNNGGYVNGNGGEIYYTFGGRPSYDPVLKRNVYLGLHEMVHAISHDVFGGFPCNRMINEGYATAVDRTYGRVSISDHMRKNVANNKLLTPNALLDGDEILEGEYYPQAGIFINWLFEKFGVAQINKIYKTDKKDFKKRFKEATNAEYDSLEKEYIEYCKTKFR
jgi:hypothetical protein